METNKDYSAEVMLALRDYFKDLVDDPDTQLHFGKRPSTTEEQMQSFILITCPVRWGDRFAFQKTTIRVNCFVRERANGILPLDKVASLTNAVMAKFPATLEGRFKFSSPVQIHNCVGDGLGFAFSTTHIDLMVLTFDRFKSEDNNQSN